MLEDSDLFRYGKQEYIQIKDYDYELDDWEETRSSYGSEGFYRWIGTVNTSIGDFDFKINQEWYADNGGTSISIVSKTKPKSLTKEEWEDFKYFLENYIENEYDLSDWLNSIRM